MLLALTLVTFLALASSLIRQDKSAYVFDSILLRTEQQAAALEAKLVTWMTLLEAPADVLATHPEVLAVVTHEGIHYQTPSLSSEQLTIIQRLPQKPWQVLESGTQTLLVLATVDRKIVVSLSGWQTPDSPFELGIYSQDGEVLLQRNSKSRLIEKDHWLWRIVSLSAQEGVQQVDDELIVAFAKLPQQNWILTSSISTDAAFAVAGYLIDKSIYFGLLILGVAILVGILAVRPLTSQLEDLGGMTDAVGSGDFSKRIKPRTHDEAGALADSFNLMAEKITVYMGEMKEKARLENELQVAQLVQNAFFPPTLVQLDRVELKSFSAPASECGGDWWGHVEFDDAIVLIIADATGHGVSAALLTASINACKQGLKTLAQIDRQLPHSPARIMDYLNKTICSSGDKIQMTCFVASWNKTTRVLSYSNASHPPGLVIDVPDSRPLEKSDVRPLLEANGARLGEATESVYTENHINLHSGAKIVLYTDGLTEAANAEGSPWGQRRFLKSLIESQVNDPAAVIEAMQAFHQRPTYDDDVTLVSARFQ
ncbi:MAG: PP2C family protein-serine/threonine phosphatase [Bacteriovoracia bacterium]